ncbi:MAG: DUF1631 family protein [Gammaproteobacteria bacterium]|nr:DUF1631 family protein [Gammaproteobacteria bacterium]
MDKRRSPRYAISLNALVHPTVGKSWLCTIQDYCDGGMLLVEQEGGRSRRGIPGISPGETVGIHFSVPLGGTDQHFRLEGKIVRVMDSGVGISFAHGMAADAIDALTQLSEKTGTKSAQPKQESATNASSTAAQKQKSGKSSAKNLSLEKKSPFSTGGLQPSDSKKIVAAIRKGVAKVLPEMTGAIFKYMDAELLEMAKEAKSNAEQSEYFAAMSNLEKAKQTVSQQFMNDVLDQIDKPRDLETLLEERKKVSDERKEASAVSRVKLSLVNTEEFEDWLAVANIISRSERSYEKYLHELLARMGMIVDSWGHAEANPLGIAVFCHAFDDAIQKISLPKEIRQKVYTGYEAKAIPLFQKLYIATTKLLEDTGLFPDLDEDFISPTRAIGGKPEAKKEEDDEKPEAVEEDDDYEDEEELSDLKDELREELKRRRRQRSARGSRSSRVSERPRQRPRKADTGSAISNLYSTVRDLLGPEEDQYVDYEFEDEDYVELEEMQGLLQTMQQEVGRISGKRIPIRQRVLDNVVVDGRQRRLAPEALERLDVVESLVDSIEDDPLLAPTAKNWVRQLELTLGKVATQRQDFLSEENPHRSLEVINQLANLGGAESSAVQRRVEEIVSEINENYDSDPAVFDSALDQLKPLMERQSRAFTGNVQRTVKASEGQQTLVSAQRAVVDEMDQLLSGQTVPEVLMRLLMPGWRNLLVNTHLRQGQGSTDWKNHVHVLDQVMSQLAGDVDTGKPDYIPPEELLEQIDSGLDSISFEPGQRTTLVNSLRKMLTTKEGTVALPMVDLSEKSVAETLGFADVTKQEEKRREIREEKEKDVTWQRFYERVQRLHVGEWVEFAQPGPEPQIAIVAWVSEDNTKMVFVNRRGVKTHELMVEELATMLLEETAKILEESEIPLTDRASHRMLQNMHNKLTHQATHDELTGLVNRKEFERELTRVLGLAKRKNIHNVVAFMDLDQFKVINNIGGHDAGDRLLIDLSQELLDTTSDTTVLSRLGGDEFGVLLEDCGKEEGMETIKKICESIKAFRFEWEKEVFSLTTSCGVVNVDSETDSVTNILRGADSACYVAKEAGRDRIQVYETDDSEMAHRKGIMEFVSQIDQSLENNRFELHCQMISPINKNGGERVHYEVLLTVLDENDKPLPPQDFIVAAETYNRMGAIDRWVIKNSFKFIATNILQLDHLGAFSINVSGNSLTEDDFMEYVLEQFNETRLPTSKICFEITETSAIGNLDEAIEFMEKLKVIGVKFSLDDFGTGLSSYSYLRNLPVDYLKIDGIFVKDIKTSPSDYAVVKSINEIGHFMGKKTIAEFVEDDEILEILREIGVDFAQGYGIGRKVPITELLA